MKWEKIKKLYNKNYIDFYKQLLLTIMEEDSEKCENIKGSESNPFSSYVELSNRHCNKRFKNVQMCTIKHFYPTILYNIINYYRFNYKSFPNAYKEIYEKYISSEDVELNNILKKWLNMTFGMINNNIIFSTKDINFDIVRTSHKILKKIHEEFKESIIYIDTDSIYFLYSPYIKEYLKNLSYDVEFENIDNMIFFRKKRYIQWENDINEKVKIKGFQTI